MENLAVIIVAGGSGTRMGAELPKQYLSLGGVPVLARTVSRFVDALPDATLIVSAAAEYQQYAVSMMNDYFPNRQIVVCQGGATRFETVSNALNYTDGCDYIAVHDSVRPLVSSQLISKTICTAERYGTAVPVVDIFDSLRQSDGTHTRPIDRRSVKIVQTPQVFSARILLEAYARPYESRFTDDATVVESAGTDITLCEGERNNIKLTVPEDMIFAEYLLNLL